MAAFFIGITLVGFIPDSLTKIAAVEAGHRPPFPIVLHVHAVLMGSFLALLLFQATLVATGRKALHQQMGILGAVLAAALVAAGFGLVPTMYHQIWAAVQVAPAEVRPSIQQALRGFENVMLLQIRIGILFSLFIAIAVLARRTNAGLHKRLMFLAVVVALPPAFERMTWLPSTMPESPLSQVFYTLLAISPMLVWDVIRTRMIHKAYIIWFAGYVLTTVVVFSAWDKEWWHAAASQLVGH